MSLTKNPNSLLFQLRSLVPKRPLTELECFQVAERQATRLLKLMDVAQPGTPTEAITGLPFVQVAVRTDLPESGHVRWAKRPPRWLILIRASEPEGRRRFTIAHELHHLLSHELDAVTHGLCTPTERYWRAELTANHFAACLLMPKRFVKAQFAAGMHDVDALARLFNVSQEAMFRRLQELGLIEPAPRGDRHHSFTVLHSKRNRIVAA